MQIWAICHTLHTKSQPPAAQIHRAENAFQLSRIWFASPHPASPPASQEPRSEGSSQEPRRAVKGSAACSHTPTSFAPRSHHSIPRTPSQCFQHASRTARQCGQHASHSTTAHSTHQLLSPQHVWCTLASSPHAAHILPSQEFQLGGKSEHHPMCPRLAPLWCTLASSPHAAHIRPSQEFQLGGKSDHHPMCPRLVPLWLRNSNLERNQSIIPCARGSHPCGSHSCGS